MNFAPEFAPDAQSQWRELDDPELQELVWDAVEGLAHNPPSEPELIAETQNYGRGGEPLFPSEDALNCLRYVLRAFALAVN